ncbi:13E12 repeat family protein [Antribacter sp. KLBMP9083]|uniref:13E12 repeat family protein n=1 Tax=Antribacter soli TaxID=2910976 RepID=A0AA41QC42_9MICO|nr:DUF222 domain-containing protein [Antribacter soli]MCF4120709.1 13E12 repeat family protein [Antribacter soli]
MRSNKAMVTQVPTAQIPGRAVAGRAGRRAVVRSGHSAPALAHAGAASGVAAGFASLSEAVDAVTAVDSLLSSLAASRAVLIESVRAWADEHPELFPAEVPPVVPALPTDGVPADGTTAPEDRLPDDEPVVLPLELVARLARALRVSEGAVVALAEESRALVYEHPRTLAAMRGGRITYGHAQTILGYTDGLHRGARTALETRLLKHAHAVTPAELSLHAREERDRRLRPARAAAAEVRPGASVEPAAPRRRAVLPRTAPGSGRAAIRPVSPVRGYGW